MKKILLIIVILVIVVVIGFLAVKFLGGGLSGPMGGKSAMDMAKEQGKQVPSEKEAISECEKSSDQESKDFCYNMIAYSYRDASLCKRIKDPEIKKGCTKEKIEEYYKLLEEGKGSVMPIVPGMPGMPGMPEQDIQGTLPNASEGSEEGTGKETISSSEQNNPIFEKNIEDISQKEMVEYCQKQVNRTVAGTRMYLKDACFHQIAVHFRNPELCNRIEVTDGSMGGGNITTRKKCLEKEKEFSEKWNAMQGKIGKMNEDLYVKIGVEQWCGMSRVGSDIEAYQKWLEEWPERLKNEFGVTVEEYKLYSETMNDYDNLWAMNLGSRVQDQVRETCPD